ncbi:hypothetical protein RchiOBHm_Chr1g0359691 [Rosa chinensis]|uniref:Uncharacterized protein n=1 Tax=Rosa chinensis TaxID=74649 RepID=A0A2P6SIF8_ROSCH|nr:hypothetical protein RchiOBHm_Chr1g0359691 [Rosa chinensis]
MNCQRFFQSTQTVPEGVFGSAFQVGVSTWCLCSTFGDYITIITSVIQQSSLVEFSTVYGFKPLGIVVTVAIGFALKPTIALFLRKSRKKAQAI